MKKNVTMWMVIMAMAVSPMLAQQADTTIKETQQETPALEETTPELTDDEQVDQAIDEATGGVWVDEAVTQEAPVPVAEPEVQKEPRQSNQNQYRSVQTLMPESGGGGYGGFSVGYTSINGLDALAMGVRGGWIMGHGFALGLAGEGFTSDFTQEGEDYYAVSGGYGGLLIEPIIFGWFPVHISLPLVIGGGGVASYTTNADPWDYDNIYVSYGEYDAFFVGEVGVEIEFNLVRFFRYTLYSNYRWTSALDMKPMSGLAPEEGFYPMSSNALNGWSFGMRFKFGSF